MRTEKPDVENSPDASTLEDIRYDVYVLKKIRKGEQQIRVGNHFTHARAKAHFAAWLEQIRRRCADIDSGNAPLLDSAGVINELREKYKR